MSADAPHAGRLQPGAPLRRVLGFWQLTASGVGIIVGAGIYVLIGPATQEAGAAVWLSFTLAAVLCALTALSYCELAAMFPSASAEYEFARQAFPRWTAFLVGWSMIAGLTVAAAAVALGFARYLQQFADVPTSAGAIIILALVAAIALTGISSSMRLTLVLTAVQVGGLLFVIAIGLPHTGQENLLDSNGLSGVLGGAALVFFAFIGFDEVITLSEETRDPTRTVPRALLAGLAISTVLYALVAIVAVSVLGADALGGSPRPLADVIAHVTHGPAADFVAAIALASTANTSLLSLTAASRLTYGMASSSALPARLGYVSARTGSPVIAVILSALVASGFALTGSVASVASVTDFAVYLVFLAVNAAVIVLRFKMPNQPRPFRSPLSLGGVPVLPVLGLLATLLMLSQLEREALGVGAVVTAAGVAASLLLLLPRKLRARGAGSAAS